MGGGWDPWFFFLNGVPCSMFFPKFISQTYPPILFLVTNMGRLINPAQSTSGPPQLKMKQTTWQYLVLFCRIIQYWFGSVKATRRGQQGLQLGAALLQPKCSISSRASPWERRCGTMVNCFYLFRAPCMTPDQVRIINQGMGGSIRTEHSFIRTPLAP